jgi:O-antigen ligase
MLPNFLTIVIYLTIFFLPILCNLVEHAGSVILLVLTLLGVYVWLTHKTKPGFDKNENRIMWSFALYFFICFFFYLANGLFRESASFYWKLDHEVRFLAFIPIYYLFYRTVLKSWTIWWGAATASIIYGIYSIWYIYGVSADNRVTGAYHAIAFGDISLVLGFISLAGIRYFQKQNNVLTFIPLIAVTNGILASFLSGTRGAIIAIPFLTVIFFIQLGSFITPWRYRTILILTIIFLSMGFYHLPGSSLDHRFRTGFGEANAFFEGKGTGPHAVRLGMWSEGWKMFIAHPICGAGRHGYELMIKQKAAMHQIPPEIEKFMSPHNMYLANMDAYGITGLFILLAIFLSPLFIFIPASKTDGPGRDMAYAGIMLIAAFMVFGMTETIFNRNININIYMILLAAILSITTAYKKT